MEGSDSNKQHIDTLQHSMLTTEPTAALIITNITGESAENIVGEDGSLFDKALIDTA